MNGLGDSVRGLTKRVHQRGVHELRKARAKTYSAIRSRGEDWLGLGPAAFVAWSRRMRVERPPFVPPQWRGIPRPSRTTDAKVGAIIHVHYPELVAEIAEHLKNIPVPFDVVVTNSSGEKLEEELFHVGLAQQVFILPVENRGRDLGPLVYAVNAGYLDPYQLVVKVHTKHSQWRAEHKVLDGDGQQWRNSLLNGLLGSQDRVKDILSLFASDPGVGLVIPEANLVGPEHWGGNEHAVTELLRRLGLHIRYRDLSFAAGSMYWVRGFILQGLRALAMSPADFEDEQGQIDGTTAHALERIVGVVTREAAYRTATTESAESVADSSRERDGSERWKRFLPETQIPPAARIVPFYLPQFHPSEINDEAWGKGFTEWANVAQVSPAFEGHAQPLVPSELGFYDLRVDAVRHRQLELEKYAGVAAFMYYYYWFSGEKVLHVPLDRTVADESLDQPFCLMWANENWTKAWDGRAEDVLLAQRYDQVGAEQFIEDVLPLLLDPNYVRVDGKAVLAVYRPAQIPDLGQVVATWRRRVREEGGGELLLLSVDTGTRFDGLGADYRSSGFDGAMGFPPHQVPWTAQTPRGLGLAREFSGRLLSYRATVRDSLAHARSQGNDYYPSVMVNFDNTARKKTAADVWYGSNPYTFRRWLADTVATVAARPYQERVVFVNAWNEWAESAVLEPTLRWGPTYLQAVRSVVWS